MALLLLLALLPLALPWRFGLLRRPLLPLVAVAAQAGFARWPSSGAAYRLQCATWSGWHAQGHSFSRPSMAKFTDFLLWLHRSQGFCLFLHQELSLDVVTSFHRVLRASSAPFGCLPLAGLCSTSFLGPCGVFFASYLPHRSHRSVRLLSARLSRWFSSLVALATAIPIGELQALSHCFSCVRGAACLSFVFPFVAKYESLLVPSLAPSWLYLCPTLRLVSTYVLCFAQFVPSAFSWTGHLPCSVAPAVILSLHAARLGLFSVAAVSVLLRVVFMRPVLPGLRLALFAHMSSVASPPL